MLTPDTRPTTSAAQIVSAHPDWITATTKDPDKQERLRGLCVDLATGQNRLGSEWTPWTWQGFQGLRCGAITWGERDRDGCSIVRVSGGLAGASWRQINPLVDNCSRLDLAVTARLDSYQGDLAAIAYRQACDAARRRGTELHCSLIVSNHGGGTAYLGSRKSELFGRCYDKERESGDGSYQNCWRWEVECKGNRALTYLHQLGDVPDERADIQRTVGLYWLDRGVSLPWQIGDGAELLGPVLVETDDDRRLAWLSEQVRSSVGGLINRGHRADVLRALGLSERDGEPVRNAIAAIDAPIGAHQGEMTL